MNTQKLFIHQKTYERTVRKLRASEEDNARLRKALEESRKAMYALDILRKNKFVFDDLDDRWQKLAFTFYTDIINIDQIATYALAPKEDEK